MHGEPHRQEHPLVALAAQPAEPLRDVDVRRGEHPGAVELAQGARGPHREARVVRHEVGRAGRRGHGRAGGAHRGLPSSRSDSSVTNAVGGRQPSTPHGVPSTAGVVGPAMPRTNRYSAPPRCASGS